MQWAGFVTRFTFDGNSGDVRFYGFDRVLEYRARLGAGLLYLIKCHAPAAVDFKFDRDGGFFFIFNKKIGSDFAF